MPWIDRLSEPAALKRCIRDLVALSTLPALWKDHGPKQIADSVAAALLSMLNADAVYVSVPDTGEEASAKILRTKQGASQPPASIGKILQTASIGQHDRVSVVENPFGEGSLRIVSVPIGLDRNNMIAVGSDSSQFPTESQRLLLGIAVNDVWIALDRWHADAERRRLVALIEQSSEFIGFASLEGEALYLNAAGCEVTGLSGLEEARQCSTFDFLAPHERDRARGINSLVMNSGRWLGELDFRNFKTGEIIPFFVDWFRIDDPGSGRPTNTATVGRDLRGQKALEAELRSLNDTLEQRVTLRTSELEDALRQLRVEASERLRADNRAQELQMELLHASRLSAAGQMAGTLAHELSQPLTALANSVAAARRLLAKAPPQRIDAAREILDEAAEGIIRAAEIIRRLREFVTRGETEKRTEDLPGLIREASNLVAAGVESKSVRVSLHFDPRAKTVCGSRIQIQQVIVNLMRNAHEAMAQSERRQLDVATACLNTGMIEIAVADSGPGLPDEIMQHLFEPFHSTKQDGMGLGLSICHSIIENHGGELRYEPNHDGGCRFRMTLPASLDDR